MRIALALGISIGGSLFAQVPNGGFENWADCSPDSWASSSVCGIIEPITKSAVAHGGSFAARGEVMTFFGQNLQPLLQSGEDGAGVPISQAYTRVEGFYIFAPVGGDRFSVSVVFFKGDNPVATGASLFPATAANTYAPFSISMVYPAAEVPDRAIITIQIIGPVTGSDFHVGSVMYVDDVSFSTGGVPVEPRLFVVRNQDGTITVSWAQEVTGYRLLRTSSLSPAQWEGAPVFEPTDRSYTFTPTDQAYFKLVSP